MSFFTSLVHAGYSHKEAFTKSAAFNSDGTVVVENVNGSIEIQSWDKNEILIEGEKLAKSEEELQRIGLTIDTSPTKAVVKVHLPKRTGFFGGTIRAAVRLKLMVPAHANLDKINTVNGAVTLKGLQGPVETHTVNGAISAHDLGDNATLKTVNGGIRASFTTITSGQVLSAETVNGGITVTLPKNAGIAVKASVVNGHIDCDFPLKLEGGRVSKRHLDATIGDGGASLRIATVNGGISLKSD